jgi:predicted HTH transcriptional regulator
MNKPQESSPHNDRQVQQLKKLIAQGEGLTLEFKRKAAYPDKIVREMIAFANTKGGILLVGIGDDKTIPGLKHPEDDSYVIKQALRKCKPALPVLEAFIPIAENRSVIQYEISESKRKPHYFQSENDRKEYFVRVADKSIKASREVREITRRGQQKRDIRFHYGEHEHTLMQYLDKHKTITLKGFAELCKLKRFIASKKLILLVLANVLHITPHEKGDLYSLAFRSPYGSSM